MRPWLGRALRRWADRVDPRKAITLQPLSAGAQIAGMNIDVDAGTIRALPGGSMTHVQVSRTGYDSRAVVLMMPGYQGGKDLGD